MGQKANPMSLRLGTKKTWKTSFSEKKPRDIGYLSYLLEQEILQCIKKIISQKSFCLKDYKIHYYEERLEIFLSLFTTEHTFKQTLKKIAKNGKTLSLNCKKTGETFVFTPDLAKNHLLHSSILKKLTNLISTRLNGKTVFFSINYSNSCLNLNSEEKQLVRKKILSLRKFKKRDFFTEGFNAFFFLNKDSNFSEVLLTIISNNLKEPRKIKPFFKFVKKTLTFLIEDPNSSIKGLKIELKGRLTKSGRARKFILNVGDVPCHSQNIDLDYTITSGQNQNGSYGVRLWVVYK